MGVKDDFEWEPVFSTLRRFDAPRDRVWSAWTRENELAQWWGPRGFTTTLCELEVRAGGAFRIDMRGPDGKVYPVRGNYQDINAPETLVFSSVALDPGGKALFEARNTVKLTERNGKTTLTLHASVTRVSPEAAAYISGMPRGWAESLDRLGEYVSRK